MRRKVMTAGALALSATVGTLPFPGVIATAQSSQKPVAFDASTNNQAEKIEPYNPRLGRKRPLIVIVGQNADSETTDFIVPFNILKRSNAADVISASVEPGPVGMRPLRFLLETTLADFDKHHPEGADYIVIPKVANDKDPVLLKWISEQAAKGSTVVSICLGAVVVANTGLLDGRRAVSWFASEADRVTRYPKVKWQRNIRYVSEGKMISSAGVSASIPISLALVEAIAGHDRAAKVARDIGVDGWSQIHNSDYFQQGGPMTMDHSKVPKPIGIQVKPGDDEMALAMTSEAYYINGETRGVVVSKDMKPIRLAHGLIVLPDKLLTGPDAPKLMLPPLDNRQPAKVLDKAIADIAATYGHAAAWKVALVMEYPGYKR